MPPTVPDCGTRGIATLHRVCLTGSNPQTRCRQEDQTAPNCDSLLHAIGTAGPLGTTGFFGLTRRLKTRPKVRPRPQDRPRDRNPKRLIIYRQIPRLSSEIQSGQSECDSIRFDNS